MVRIYTGYSVLLIGLLFPCQYRLAFHYALKANNEQGKVFCLFLCWFVWLFLFVLCDSPAQKERFLSKTTLLTLV